MDGRDKPGHDGKGAVARVAESPMPHGLSRIARTQGRTALGADRVDLHHA